MSIYTKLLIIGDSLSNFARSNTTWWIELGKLSKAKYGVRIVPVTFIRSGWTSKELLIEATRILEDYRGKIKEVVVQFGTNDAKGGVSKNDFADILDAWIDAAFGYRMYMWTIPMPLGFGSAGYDVYSRDRIAEFNEVILRRRNVLNIVDVSNVLDKPEFFADGIHFTDLGCEVVAEEVLKTIEEVRLWTPQE